MGKVIGTADNNAWTRMRAAAFRKVAELAIRARTSPLQKSPQIFMTVPERPMPELCNDDLEDMLALDYNGG